MHLGAYWRGAAGAILATTLLTVLCVSQPRLVLASAKDGLSPTRTYSWHQATAAAEWPPRSGQAGLFFHRKLWLLAGSSDLGDGRLNDIWFSVDGVNWTQVTAGAPWAPRAGHSALDFRNKLWVLDGGGRTNYYRDVWCSIDGMQWENATADAAWSSRAAPVVQYKNKMYLIGGYEPLQTLADVWTSPDGSNWARVVAQAPWPSRSAQRPVVFLDRLWITGGWHYGSDIETGYLHDVWSTSDGATWTEATASAGWHSRAGHAAATFDDQLWVLGGHYTIGTGLDAYTVFLNDVWASTDGTDWIQAPTPAWAPRHGHSAVVFHNRLWLFGGKVKVGSQDSFFANDVWYMAPDPGASFSGTPWSGVAPLAVQFTDDSTAEAAPISSWNWDFGDGTSSTERNPSHTYSTRGIYTVSLTVTAGDFYNTATEEAYISVAGEQHPFHTADQNQDNKIALSELLRVIQFFNSGGLHCQSGTEDGYAPGQGGATDCAFYDSDYYPPDWKINLTEVLRVIQFFNMHGYHACPGQGTEDGYCPGAA